MIKHPGIAQTQVLHQVLLWELPGIDTVIENGIEAKEAEQGPEGYIQFK